MFPMRVGFIFQIEFTLDREIRNQKKGELYVSFYAIL